MTETETRIESNTHALEIAIRVEDWDSARVLWNRLLALCSPTHPHVLALLQNEETLSQLVAQQSTLVH